ncbi:OB-fold domain-containing protein [Hoeflea sp. YIM 152468]|uniref:Zn-ribbon domain-containing OB-fold protein n=1 Tax=Hoeflea sp. YIM 152468 TaxID=3031759 RepID=UPI0023DA6E1A|nr:OB-fold domain-containing protein [Hoeflea sp. YIM 152468]MDF1608676.1 OB-fold domain-containing protein [Hoeflea sp. YIM 152468]
MTQALNYPMPSEDADNRAFLTAWREEGKLLLQKAAPDGRPFFYPRPICPYTGSADLVSVPASGKGRIVSYALVLRPNHPAFNDDVPIILAEIELEEGASLLGRIICEEASSVASGLDVELLPPADAKRYPLPTFRLQTSGDE